MLSYSDPFYGSTGDPYLEARLQQLFTASTFQGAVREADGTQSIATTGVFTIVLLPTLVANPLQWNTSELGIAVPVSGMYRITTHFRWADAIGAFDRGYRIDFAGGNGIYPKELEYWMDRDAVGRWSSSNTADVFLSADTSILINAIQSSGANLVVQRAFLSVQFLGGV